MKILATKNMYNTYEDYEASGKFDAGQLNEIYLGFGRGMSPGAIRVFASPQFDKSQMAVLRRGLESNSRRLMSYVVDPAFSAEQMRELVAAITDGISEDILNIMANPVFDRDQMRQIYCVGNIDGVSIDLVRTVANPELDSEQMYQARKALEQCVITDDEFIQYTKPEYPARLLSTIYLGLERDELKEYIPEFIRICQSHDISKFTNDRLGYLLGFLAKDIPEDFIEYLFFSGEFDMRQLYEIYVGIHRGLSLAQVESYADPKIPYDEMENIRLNLLGGEG